MKILDRIERNRINYESLITYKDVDQTPRILNMVIGGRGRIRFVEPLFKSVNRARLNMDIGVTIVEHSHKSEYRDLCLQYKMNYIWIECSREDQYNRSLTNNVGVLFGPQAEWVVTHDLDCLVQSDFFDKLKSNSENQKTDVFQSFTKRRVIYCNEELTSKLISGDVDVDSLSEGSFGTFTCKGKAPGGSMFMSRRMFFMVGGYDPELFTGYAPEDQMLWDKLSLFKQVCSCDHPPIEVFHLNHPPTMHTNPRHREMVDIVKNFERLPVEERLKIVSLKRQIIQEWE